MLIDAHVHIFGDRMMAGLAQVRAAEPWFASCHPEKQVVSTMVSPDQLVAAMDANGVDRAVVLGWPFASPALCAEMCDVIASAVARFPDRLIGFGVVQPNDGGAVEEIKRCSELGLAGIGELSSDAQGFAWDNWDLLEPLVDASVELGMVWNIHCSEPVGHTYPGKGMATPGPVFAFLQHAQELRVVCAHLGGGLPLYSYMPEVLEVCQRVWFDTAAVPFLYSEAIYGQLINLIGDRLLFGSDYPLLKPSRYLPSFAKLSVQAEAAICSHTAEALFQTRFKGA